MHAGEPRGFGLRLRLLGRLLLHEALALVGDLLLVGLGRRIGEAFGEQVVAA